MFENYRDIMNLTYAFFEVSGEITYLAKVGFFLVNRKMSTVILKQIRRDFIIILIDDNLWIGKEIGLQHHFAAADNECHLLAKINNILIILAVIAHTGAPFAIVVINLYFGTLKKEILVHPFKGV